MDLFDRMKSGVIDGRDEDVRRLAGSALEAGHAPAEILTKGLVAGMDVVGAAFRAREIFLPDVLLAARAMSAGIEVLRPLMEGQSIPSRGTVVLGTVQGDLHDIGKNLVAILLRGAGYEVVDLGNNVAPETFVQAARDRKADVVGMSALLTTTMPVMGRVVAALKEAGLGGVRIVVGGAPLSENFAREIGADGYGYDASRAVEIVREWLA